MLSLTELYHAMARCGNIIELGVRGDIQRLTKGLSLFEKDWKQYNPRKDIKRFGLSVTSIDGELSGVADLDSIYEFNKLNQLNLNEMSFKKKTQVYPLVSEWLDPFEQYLGRTHLLKFQPGGFFPAHRDSSLKIIPKTFRMILPISNCNYPQSVTLLNGQVCRFNHGSLYFMDTFHEHLTFNPSVSDDVIMLVANVELTQSSVEKVLSLMLSK